MSDTAEIEHVSKLEIEHVSKLEIEHVSIQHRPLDSVHPSPENAKLYHPVLPNDPEVMAVPFAS